MNRKMCMTIAACILVLSLAVLDQPMAQDVEAPPLYRQEELDQMLAPIALYPDALLIQVLMAATYPLEVVAADRWVRANPNMQSDDLALALEQKNWDPSVKSIVNFPSVLAMLSERLDWMQRVGDAFLAQKDQVMDTVQELRARAQAAGNLQTTVEQRVVIQNREIIIEPANPSIIYVPVYNPAVVYGPWWYPAYPPFWYYPAGFVIGPSVFAFGPAFYVGPAWGYAWGGCSWRRHHVYVSPYRNMALNKHMRWNEWDKRYPGKNGGPVEWKHNPVHRKGVAYKDPSVHRLYGQTPRPTGSAVGGPKNGATGPGMKPTMPSVRPAGKTGQVAPQGPAMPGQGRQAVKEQKPVITPAHASAVTPGRRGSVQGPSAPGQNRLAADRSPTSVGQLRTAANRSRIAAGSGTTYNQPKAPAAVDRPAVGTQREMPRAATPVLRPTANSFPATARSTHIMGATFRGGSAAPLFLGGGNFSGRTGGGGISNGRPSGGAGRGGGRNS